MVHLQISSPGIPETKNITVQRKIQSWQQMTDKDSGPQIHNLYINVMSWFMDHKKGEISKKFSIESIFCNLRLPGINWCRSVTGSQGTGWKYFTSYLLQAEAWTICRNHVAFRPDENEMLLEWLAMDHEQCGWGQRRRFRLVSRLTIKYDHDLILYPTSKAFPLSLNNSYHGTSLRHLNH